MHKGKKHTESSYQPIKDKDGKVILTSEQARNVDEDFPSTNESSHEFDHKPAQSDVEKAKFINAKMKKLRKKSQGRKAVTDLNKAISDAKGPSRISRETDSINSVNAFKKMEGDYMSRKFKGNDERLGPITPEQNKAEYDREKLEFYYNTDENKMKMIPTDDGEQRDKAFMGKLENYQLAPERKSALNMLGMGVSRCWSGYKPNPDGRPASEKGSCVKK